MSSELEKEFPKKKIFKGYKASSFHLLLLCHNGICLCSS